jgi:exopolysaccharide production protein ExoY
MKSAVACTSRTPARPADRSQSVLYAIDRVLAALVLVMAAPVIFVCALITLCLCFRPPLVAHLRAGRHGRPFWMLKLRTMWGPGTTYDPASWFVERLASGDPESKGAHDARVCSSFARMCRKFSLDELPQLANVVIGEMALVGPRPITNSELVKYYGSSAEEVTRISPGITGLWQVMGRSRLSYPQRRRLDLFLVRRFSAGLYLSILLRTIPGVFSGRNAW